MKRKLILDINVRTEGPGTGVIIEWDDQGNVTSEKQLSDTELSQELDSNTWENPFSSWVGRDTQRLTHEEKK